MRQLDDRERIAACLDDDPLQHALVEPRRQDRVQQRAGVPMAQRLDVKLRPATERPDRLSRREDHRDPLGQEAAGDEREHARRRVVEPLRVVDDTQEGLVLGRLRQQVENRQPDQERIRRPPGVQPECNFEGGALRIRQALQNAEALRAQLMEGGERELHLGFDADGAGHPEVRAGLDGVLEQRRLADARLAVDRKHAAVALACRLQHAVEDLALALSSEQPHARGPRDHPKRTLLAVADYGFRGFDRRRCRWTMPT